MEETPYVLSVEKETGLVWMCPYIFARMHYFFLKEIEVLEEPDYLVGDPFGGWG